MNSKTIISLLGITLALGGQMEAQIPINTTCGNYFCEQGGTLQIVSATGSFSSISGTNKILNVSPGLPLNGTVTLSAFDITPGGDIVPLIYTPSWGNDSNSWRLINSWIPIGQSTQQAQVSLTAPSTPGTHHIIFAFAWELSGDQVASASNWQLGYDVWDDGNDIAEFSASQIASAQLNGYVLDEWLGLGANGTAQYVPQYIPSDAITLIVGATPSRATATATITNGSVSGATITDGGFGYTNTPLVLILGGGGTGASAAAVVSNGVVVNVNITDGGTGYTSTPVIYIYSPLGLQIGLVKAVKPSFSDLAIGTNYQLQVSGGSLNAWTNQGSPFTATNPVMPYPLYFDVCDWGQLYFRLQASP